MSWNSVLAFNTNGYPNAINGVAISSLPSIQGDANSFLHNDGFGNWSWQIIDAAWITGLVSGHAIKEEGGAALTQRANLNFIGASVTATDNAGTNATDITITATGSGDVVGPASAVDNDLAAFDTTTGKLIKDSGVLTSDAASAVSLKHTRSHAITGTSDHTSTATPGQMLKADASGLPIDATNTDAAVSAAVTASHAAVTLDANADAFLGLTGQQVNVDSQAANKFLASPSGGAGVMTPRVQVFADLPAITLDNLSDVTVPTPTSGDFLKWSGTTWISSQPTSVVGSAASFYLDATTALADNLTLSISPSVYAEVANIKAVTAASAPIFFERFVSGALGRTSIPAGNWVFDIYAATNNNAGTNVIKWRINKRVAQTGLTGTFTGAGATRTFTVTGGTPFVAGDANASELLASLIETPTQTAWITGFTSSSVVTVTLTDPAFVNVAGVSLDGIYYWLFGDQTGALTGATAALYQITSVQAAFTGLNDTDRIVLALFASTAGVATRNLTLYYGGSLHFTHFESPISTLHNDLAGLNVGDYKHLTAAEYTSNGYATGTVGQVAEFVTNTHTLQAAKIIGPAVNILTLTNSAAATLALAITSAKTLTLTATDNFNLTVPATGTAALGAATLTVSTTNDVTGATHSHAITSSANPGAAASLLATDASGNLRVEAFIAGGVGSFFATGGIRFYDGGANYAAFKKAGDGGIRVITFQDATQTVARTDAAQTFLGTITASHFVDAGATAFGLLYSDVAVQNTNLPVGLTTEILVGGGAGAAPVWTTATGSGAPVRANTPTLITPVLGVATATSINKITLTQPANGSTLTILNGKTLTINDTMTLAGNYTLTIPESLTAAGRNVANTFVESQTFSKAPIVPASAGTAVFALDVSAGTTIVIANNATTQPSGGSNFSGLVFVTDTATDGTIGGFIIGGGFSNLFGGSTTIYSNTQGTANKINVYQDGSIIVTIENKSGVSRTLRVMMIRTRNA